MTRAGPRASYLCDPGRWPVSDDGGISYPAANSDGNRRRVTPVMTHEMHAVAPVGTLFGTPALETGARVSAAIIRKSSYCICCCISYACV